ncbi:MAG TPA: cation diffusion facilitator family transporter [Acidobacteriota bacterium]|jgi:cation diffusion facilitator family transporter
MKSRTARFAIIMALFLALLKMLVGFWMNSVAVLATAADSLLDLFTSTINFISLRKSAEPPDREHPFGHGKAESLAALFQFVVILSTAGFILWRAYQKFVSQEPVRFLAPGLLALAISSLASIYIARRLVSVGRQTESVALLADSLHYRLDAFATGGTIVALMLTWWRGWHWVDPTISLVISLGILVAAARMGIRSIDELMDKQLPDETRREIERIIEGFKPEILSYHNLRTRKSGAQKFIDFHIVIPASRPFGEAHRLTEELMARIQERIPNADVMVHTDPQGEADRF